jgi:hypothetical protein
MAFYGLQRLLRRKPAAPSGHQDRIIPLVSPLFSTAWPPQHRSEPEAFSRLRHESMSAERSDV